MQFTHHVPIPLPLASIDLGEWIFELTDKDYRACASGHRAMGVVGGARHLGLVNIEVEAPLWVRFLGWFNRSNHFLHRHLIEETSAFARDITSKYATSKAAGRARIATLQPLHQ